MKVHNEKKVHFPMIFSVLLILKIIYIKIHISQYIKFYKKKSILK
jgi:hypothetical protein